MVSKRWLGALFVVSKRWLLGMKSSGGVGVSGWVGCPSGGGGGGSLSMCELQAWCGDTPFHP